MKKVGWIAKVRPNVARPVLLTFFCVPVSSEIKMSLSSGFQDWEERKLSCLGSVLLTRLEGERQRKDKIVFLASVVFKMPR